MPIMKTLFLMGMVMFGSCCFGQGSIGFENTSATWNVVTTTPGGSIQFPDFVQSTTEIYGFKNDTVINNITWHQFCFTQDSNFAKSFQISKAGLVRELNDVVLYMDSTGQVDTLYNFNMHVGDSVRYNMALGNNFFYVISMDSIEIDNQYYKRFFFNKSLGGPESLSEMWIENLGSIHGPLFPLHPQLFDEAEVPDSVWLSCCKANNAVVWNNSSFSECYVNIVLANPIEQDLKLSISPNPVSNRLFINLPEGLNQTAGYQIMNITGKIILEGKLSLGKSIDVDTSNLPDGTYILQLIIQGRSYEAKFIKLYF